MPETLSNNDLQLINAYWRAANYLSVGQIYLYNNPLLKNRLPKKTSSRGCSVIGGQRPA
jgi:xylulose-5-phosphate/fructose-6-phosphate phosphoketolase